MVDDEIIVSLPDTSYAGTVANDKARELGWIALFSGRERCDEIVRCLAVAIVAHPIILVSHDVFAFTRLMAVCSALALALILGHLVSRSERSPSCVHFMRMV